MSDISNSSDEFIQTLGCLVSAKERLLLIIGDDNLGLQVATRLARVANQVDVLPLFVVDRTRLEKLANQDEFSNAHLLEGSVERGIPLDSRVVQAVVVCAPGSLPAVSHEEEPNRIYLGDKLIDECYRVLIPGGVIAFFRNSIWKFRDGDEGAKRKLIAKLKSLWELAFTSKSYDERDIRQQLHESGFVDIHTYAVVPGHENPRFLIPCKPKSAAVRSLKLYEPTSVANRLKKWTGRIVLWSGLDSYILGDSVIIAHKPQISSITSGFESLNQFLRRLFGIPLVLALSAGTPDYGCKITIQAMDLQGRIVAYVKLGDTAPAKALLSHEGNILQRVEGLRLVSAGYPRLLHVAEWRDYRVLVQSPPQGKFRAGPTELTGLHIDFLTELFVKTATRRVLASSDCFLEMQSGMNDLHGCVPDVWIDRLNRAFGIVRKSIGHRELRLGLCHGDFAPWNTRLCDGGLFVFDWEHAREATIPFWDVFHFIIQTSVLLQDRHAETIHDILVNIGQDSNKVMLRYCEATETDPSLIPYLLLFHLCDMSIFRLRKVYEFGVTYEKDLKVMKVGGCILDRVLYELLY